MWAQRLHCKPTQAGWYLPGGLQAGSQCFWRPLLRWRRPRRKHVAAADAQQQKGQGGSVLHTAAASPRTPPPALQPTRLQQQVEELLAIDVECAHFGVPGQPRVAHLPAEVCIVDAQRNTVLRTHCNPLTPKQTGWKFVGGVPPTEWEGAPSLKEVRARIAELIKGRVLVGHNLPQDLATLGLTHPKKLQRDTMRYRQLQSGKKSGQRLATLSEQKLGRKIQESRRHDPREDALAALDLYIQHVHMDPGSMDYEDLVEHHLAEILAAAAAGGDSPQLESPGGDSRQNGGSSVGSVEGCNNGGGGE